MSESMMQSESMNYHQPQEHFRNRQQNMGYKTGLKNKRVVILGGGFAGIEILKRLQKEFRDDNCIGQEVLIQC